MTLIELILRLIFPIILTIVSCKLTFLNGNKTFVICGVWIYFISPIIALMFFAYSLIALLKGIGLILVIIGVIKSIVKNQRTKENKNDNTPKININDKKQDITNIID